MVNATELWRTSEQAIVNYTGLSPATFFTVLAISLTLYYVVSGWFRSPTPTTREVVEEVMEPLPPPVELGEITAEELSAYDGSDSKKPLLMAIKGQIYDVTQSRMFYGPGGPYALFTGKDASRALAKMSFEKEDLTGDTSGLGPFELEALQDWEYKFMSKYVKVGTVKKTVPVTDGSTSETTEASTVTTEDSPTVCPGEHTVESKDDREVHVPKHEPKEVKTEIVDEVGEHTVETKVDREAHVPEPKEVKTEKVDEVEDAKE